MATQQVSIGSHGHGGCACGDAATAVPVLDARQIPHEVRHAAIFGALDSITPGRAMDLLAPHDPKPLLAQAAERYEGGFDVDYVERGPQWRLRFTRR